MRVPVKLGYMDGDWAEVRGGLKEGDQVVTAGKIALRDGTVVQVLGQPAEGGRRPPKPTPRSSNARTSARDATCERIDQASIWSSSPRAAASPWRW